MLAPFFVNLLMWCVVLLITGWAVDVINGLRDSARHGSSHLSRSMSASAMRFKPHVSAVVGCQVNGDSLFRSGVTKRPKNA
jgi:hypothetical protein